MIIKSTLKRIPFFLSLRRLLLQVIHEVHEFLLITRFKLPYYPIVNRPIARNVIVSLTSFPARIKYAWIPIESILRQSLKADMLVLVLAEEQFPDRKLPKKIIKQTARGLSILWIRDDLRSYKKLIPVRSKFPDYAIITIDDDVVYKRNFLKRLLMEANSFPQTVIGTTGREILSNGSELIPYVKWVRPTSCTPGTKTLLTGVGGIYYPANLIPTDDLCDAEKALKICPTCDDIWFWAVSRNLGVPHRCIGGAWFWPIRCMNQTPALSTVNWRQNGNDRQINAAMEYFDIKKNILAETREITSAGD